ncbi:MAG: undecaprenyl diphosphate synthase family protein [Ilumatobacteraceae bacterium]
MGDVTAPLTSSRPPEVAGSSSMRHVMVVGGTLHEWAELDDESWNSRVDELGAVGASAGVAWLTIRPCATGRDPARLHRWHRLVGCCCVIVDPSGDGRERFADAMARLDSADEVNEVSVAMALYEPADSEPDLVVVLGPATQLPPSLVWELAYAELVFIPVDWRDLGARHLLSAMDDFAGRRRRFGGLDE